jgi:hypothetical protein
MRLPLERLSVTSLSTYLSCPVRFKRRYLLREYEPKSPALVIGSAAAQATAYAHGQVAAGHERPPVEETLEEYVAAFERAASEEEVEWGETKPGEAKDLGARCVEAYETSLGPKARPAYVERCLEGTVEDVPLIAYLDREDVDGTIADLKVRARRMAVEEARVDLQAGLYLLLREGAGEAAPKFTFEVVTKTRQPQTQEVVVERRDALSGAVVARQVAQLAELIEWSTERDIWPYAAPGSFACRVCGFLDCPLNLRRATGGDA